MSNTSSKLIQPVKQSTGGYDMALSAIAFGLVGFWLDKKFDLMPWLFITFTVLGFIGAAISVYYRYQHQMTQLAEDRNL